MDPQNYGRNVSFAPCGETLLDAKFVLTFLNSEMRIQKDATAFPFAEIEAAHEQNRHTC